MNEETIRALEERLLRPEVRGSKQELDSLLADEFIEHGSSGRIYNKKQVMDGLLNGDKDEAFLVNFVATPLADGIMLATYSVVKRRPDDHEDYSLRSSVWKLIDGRWQMIFHQGTPANGCA